MPMTAANFDAAEAALLRGLIERAGDGCREAMAELVRRHERVVRLYLARFVATAADADDLAQEVFLTMFRDLDSYDSDAPFTAWLLTIARNRALHHLRSEVRRRRREGDAVRLNLARAQVEAAEADDPQNAERELIALRDCLDGLPPNSRRLVDAFYFAGQSAEQIAARRDAKAGTVRMTLLRIRRSLADCIEQRASTLEESP